MIIGHPEKKQDCGSGLKCNVVKAADSRPLKWQDSDCYYFLILVKCWIGWIGNLLDISCNKLMYLDITWYIMAIKKYYSKNQRGGYYKALRKTQYHTCLDAPCTIDYNHHLKLRWVWVTVIIQWTSSNKPLPYLLQWGFKQQNCFIETVHRCQVVCPTNTLLRTNISPQWFSFFFAYKSRLFLSKRYVNSTYQYFGPRRSTGLQWAMKLNRIPSIKMNRLFT